jgi:fucose permease
MNNSESIVLVPSEQDRHRFKYLFIIGVLFFVFGFVTWLGSVLIPYLKITCELNNVSSYLIAFSFYISYLVLALPSAALLKKQGLNVGCPSYSMMKYAGF